MSVTSTSKTVKQILAVIQQGPAGGEHFATNGLVSDVYRSQARHCYLALNAEGALLWCVALRDVAQTFEFWVQNGQHLWVEGRLSFFEQRGRWQLMLERAELLQGAAHEPFWRLKKRARPLTALLDWLTNKKTPVNRTMKRLLGSFVYARAGLYYLFQTQANARIHLSIGAVVVLTGLWLGLPAHDWALLALTIGFVLVAEALNTALEAAVDLTSPQMHPLAKRAKDVGAGAVLLAAVMSVVVGLLILGPPLWARLIG